MVYMDEDLCVMIWMEICKLYEWKFLCNDLNENMKIMIWMKISEWFFEWKCLDEIDIMLWRTKYENDQMIYVNINMIKWKL